MARTFGAAAARGSILGLRSASAAAADPAALYTPTPADTAALRAAAHAWGVPRFRAWPLLLRALTHASVSNWGGRRAPAGEAAGSGIAQAHLEFLGDRVVGAAVAAEGGRSSMALLGNAGFALAARRAGIDGLLRCPTRCAGLVSVLADAYEAVAAAVYLDGGMGAAREFVEVTLLPYAEEIRGLNKDLNRLRIELAEAVRGKLGDAAVVVREEYAVVGGVVVPELSGGGDRTFEYRLRLHGGPGKDACKEVVVGARGGSRNAAEVCAIEDALARLGELPDVELRGEEVEVVRGPPGHQNSLQWRHDRILRATSGHKRSDAVLVDAGAVDACLDEFVPDLAVCSVSGAHVTAAVDGWMRASLSLDARALRSALSEAADAGHRVYWLCLAEAVFRGAPRAPRPVLQAALLHAHARRVALAQHMGGRAAGGKCGLVSRPHGRMMLFVALGVVVRDLGFEAAFAWVEGGRRLLGGVEGR